MILNRLGNKTKISDKIQSYFPKHKIYLEPFFGAGGMFFNKPKAKYNVVNDYDNDVFNLYNVLIKEKDTLYEYVFKMPIHETLWQYWRANKEVEPIAKAVRFLFLSNFGYMGKSETLRFCNGNQKKLLLEYIDLTYKYIWDVEFMNCDFRKFFKKIPEKEMCSDTFTYLDPPYLDTTNNYEHSFTNEDSIDLFKTANDLNIKFAMSEFDHPLIIEQAKDYKFNIINIGERLNMKNRRTEVLITNYETSQQSLF